MEQDEIIVKLKELIQAQKEISFTNPSEANDKDALGVMISNLYEWTPKYIVQTMLWALEDANAHSWVPKIEKVTGVGMEDD